MKTLLEVIALFVFTAFIAIILMALVGCNSSSSSGGGPQEPAKLNICQTCSRDSQCESNRCVQFKSGMWRCVPTSVTKYECPQGQYSLSGDSCS